MSLFMRIEWKSRGTRSLAWIGILALALLSPLASSASELRWVPRATVPQMPKEGFTVTEFKGKLWMVGGLGSNLSSTYPNQILSSEDGLAWSAPAGSFPFLERKGHAAVVFNDKLYIIGGRKANETMAGDMWRSPDGLFWEKVEADPAVAARYGHAAAVYGGELWVTGGVNASGALRKDAWLTYNGNYWMAPPADFLVGRSGHRLASHEGRLWVAGGKVAGPSGSVSTGEVWLSPINGGNWTVESSDLDFNVRTHGLASVNGGLWAFGSSLFSGPVGVFGGFSASVRQGLDAWRFIPSLSESGGAHENAEVVHFQNTFFRFGSLAFEDHVASMEPFYKLNLVAGHGRILFVSEGDISTPDHFYRPGTSGYLVPVPDPGYAFGGWSGDVQGESDHQAITLDRDKTAIALFESAFPVVTVNVAGNGRVSPSGAVTVPHGTDKLFEIRPRSGSRLIRISVDGQDQPLGSSLNLKNVRRNKTLLVQFEGCTPAVIQPNYVKLLTYDDEGAAPVTTYAVPDGFGSPAQNQLDMGGGSFLVSANIEDGVGLVTKDVKPYVASGRSEFRFEPMECEDVVLKANAYYDGSTEDRPNAEGYAFSEVRYRLEPAAQGASRGIPGKAFSVDSEESGHPNRMWRFGATGRNDFLSPAELTEADLEARESPYGGEYQLTVSRDPNGHYAQVMADQFGNVVARWGNPSPSDASQAVVSKAAYDIMGRLTEDIPPLGAAYQSEYARTLSGELLSEKTADGGMIEYRYNAQGQTRFLKTAKQKAMDLRDPTKHHYLLFSFDGLGRITTVSENNGTHDFDQPETPFTSAEGDTLVRKRFLYDALTLADLQGLGLTAPATVLAAVAEEVKSQPGQLAAAIAFGPDSHKTATLFSYDVRGRVTAEYLFLPGNVPAQKFEFAYDLAGKVLDESYFNGYDPVLHQWVMENLKETEYDPLQRVKQINIDGERRFTLEYQPRGTLAREKLYVPGQTQPLEELAYRFSLQDWIQRIATPGAVPRFKTDLDYGTLFNGNIEKAEYAYQLNSTTRLTQDYAYAYDGMDRLTQAGTASDPDYASYGYDAQGRLTQKKEGANTLPAFAYAPGKNQIARIPGDVDKGHPNAYVYDPEGNLVLDRSKRMAIDYDALGQAVSFRIYQDIPEATLTWEDVEANGLATRFGRTLQETITVAYDAFGQRVLKHTQGAAESATAYVGEFAELTSPDGDGPWTLDGLSHWTPMGLRGRRVAGADFVYLTDHMGSVRMGIDAMGQVVEGLDYTPYGRPLPIVMGQTGVARHGYTEKEHDGEMGLTYFGARYLDPELGSWTAVDPMGQYHNSYGFVGGNPINFIDPWGLEAVANNNQDPGRILPDYLIIGKGPKAPEPAPTTIVVVTPPMNFEVDRSNGEVPTPPGLGPLDLALKGYDIAVDAIPSIDDLPEVMSDAESGKMRGEDGKVDRGKVTKASLILVAGVVFDGEGRVLKAAKGLSGPTLSNFNRFSSKLPAGAGEIGVHNLPGGGKAFSSTVPGRVPGSSAIYEKQVDAGGKTLQYFKTTIGPDGKVIHVKDKITGATITGY